MDILTDLFSPLGGWSIVVIGLSSWLGKVWATKVINKEKQNFELLFNEIKEERSRLSSAMKDAEQRYSSKQFELYNILWHSLIDLKYSGDSLWEKVGKGKLKNFANQVKKTKKSIDNNALIITNEHYTKLMDTMHKFDNFQFGKQKLIELYNENIDYQNFSEEEIRNTIEQNKELREEYTNLIEELKIQFIDQILGKNI